MKTVRPTSRSIKWKNQRGAALVSTLLISALLLTAGGMLILTTSLTGTNTIDAASEMQAYYGAEAGLQATLHVLRGNVSPTPLFTANPPGGVAPQNIIDFRKAMTRATSNAAGDPAGANIRLSRWLTYNYTPPAGAFADRVGISPGYNPFTGTAYSIRIMDDPDATPAGRPPQRMIIESTGYGPRGARKTLSMLVSANGLDIDVPAPLVIRGHDDLTIDSAYQLGTSAAKTYSGVDTRGGPDKPTIVVSGHDVDAIQAAYAHKPASIASTPRVAALTLPGDPAPAGIQTVPTPWFLTTADNARAFLVQAETLANSCATAGNPCPLKRGVVLNSLNGSAGASGAPQFTIVKGDCNLDGGAGLLIVTGTLFFDGPGPNFDGIILLMGAGRLVKIGGGNRDILGSMMVARFGATGGFLDPSFDYGAAGSSNLQYDSTAALNAMVMPGAKVLGVVER